VPGIPYASLFFPQTNIVPSPPPSLLPFCMCSYPLPFCPNAGAIVVFFVLFPVHHLFLQKPLVVGRYTPLPVSLPSVLSDATFSPPFFCLFFEPPCSRLKLAPFPLRPLFFHFALTQDSVIKWTSYDRRCFFVMARIVLALNTYPFPPLPSSDAVSLQLIGLRRFCPPPSRPFLFCFSPFALRSFFFNFPFPPFPLNKPNRTLPGRWVGLFLCLLDLPLPRYDRLPFFFSPFSFLLNRAFCFFFFVSLFIWTYAPKPFTPTV